MSGTTMVCFSRVRVKSTERLRFFQGTLLTKIFQTPPILAANFKGYRVGLILCEKNSSFMKIQGYRAKVRVRLGPNWCIRPLFIDSTGAHMAVGLGKAPARALAAANS